ncbi:MAG: ABC transporter substrate binding protein [bacterium]|nr:ABC transporter substrate binding protein [bacterium]
MRILLVTVLFWLFASGTGQAQRVVAILSSELGPYQEAFAGFQSVLGMPVSRVLLAEHDPYIGRDVRVVVAFGGKAALKAYPGQVTVISCLAPGIGQSTYPNAFVKVHMLPQAPLLVGTLRKIQPEMKRLAVFWASEATEDYLEEMREAAWAQNLEILEEQVENPDDLPDILRKLIRNGVDAMWLPPDPLLINARSFSVLKEFSWANDIPFYVPTAGLVKKGAVASVSCSFDEIGRTAGRTVRDVLTGRSSGGLIYPEKIEITVNLTAASNTGLVIPKDVLDGVDTVLP